MLQILCIAAAINAIGTNSSLAYLILDRSHLTAAANVVRLLLLAFAVIVVAPPYGIEGVAYAIAGVNAVMVAADYMLAPWRLGLKTDAIHRRGLAAGGRVARDVRRRVARAARDSRRRRT